MIANKTFGDHCFSAIGKVAKITEILTRWCPSWTDYLSKAAASSWTFGLTLVSFSYLYFFSGVGISFGCVQQMQEGTMIWSNWFLRLGFRGFGGFGRGATLDASILRTALGEGRPLPGAGAPPGRTQNFEKWERFLNSVHSCVFWNVLKCEDLWSVVTDSTQWFSAWN